MLVFKGVGIQRSLVSVFITEYDFHPFLATLQRFGYVNHGTWSDGGLLVLLEVITVPLTHTSLKDLADFLSIDYPIRNAKLNI